MSKFYHQNDLQIGFFDEQDYFNALSELGNPLEIVSQIIDFEMFREPLTKALEKQQRKSRAGRPPFDPVFVFKCLFLQRMYGLSDHQAQFLMIDRISFRRFLGVSRADDIPDEKTLWKYREALCQDGVFDHLFEQFHQHLQEQGCIANEGKIIDASFVEMPIQRNSRDENAQIKKGKGSKLWSENKHKKAHKDTDARWTKKNQQNHYGYKMHVKADRKSKLIDDYHVTAANVHDNKGVAALLSDKDRGQDLLLDSGYVGPAVENMAKAVGMNPIVCAKGYRNKPLNDEQKSANKPIARVRCRIEHIFGFIEGSMKGLVVRSVGMLRAKANIALTALTYNMLRLCQIVKLGMN